jgi:hypothetical protein
VPLRFVLHTVVANDVFILVLVGVTRVLNVQRRFVLRMAAANDVCILVLVDVTRVLPV